MRGLTKEIYYEFCETILFIYNNKAPNYEIMSNYDVIMMF